MSERAQQPTQKALVISAVYRRIEEGTVAGVASLHEIVGGYLEVAYQWPETGDVLYVNENGMLIPDTPLFRITVRPDQPMFGNGVIVGREIEDETAPAGFRLAPPAITADQLRQMVTWL